ncbi:spermatogenesis-associated serine-rich protein 2-like isoform X3 [Argonauta hians]
MTRKNSQKTDTSGALVFDTRTKSVMSQVGNDNVKQKVQAVKEIVPGKNANEIILVLQYYDNCVERTIQAYVEDGAKEALNEWHLPDNKLLKQKKKNKKKKLNQNFASGDQPTKSTNQGAVKVTNGVVNGHSDMKKGDPKADLGSNVVSKAKKPYAGLEKSVKDLNRQTVALDRIQLVFNDEMKKAYKRITSVFEEMYSCLKERESQMIKELDQVNEDAADVFKLRKEKAAELKVDKDRAQQMTDSEVAQLRTQIKEFVSLRRLDDDLGRVTRFQYDSDHLRNEINKFAEIIPVNKGAYTVINRPNQSETSSTNECCSISSSSSNISSNLQAAPVSSSTADVTPSNSLPEQTNGNHSSLSNPTLPTATTEAPVTHSSTTTNSDQYQHSRTFSSNYRSSDYRSYSSGRSRGYHQGSNRGHRRGDGGYRGNSDSNYPPPPPREERVQYLGRGVHFGPRRARGRGGPGGRTNFREQDKNSVANNR